MPANDSNITSLEKVYIVYLNYLRGLDPPHHRVAEIEATMLLTERWDKVIKEKTKTDYPTEQIENTGISLDLLEEGFAEFEKESDLNNQLAYITHFSCEMDLFASLIYQSKDGFFNFGTHYSLLYAFNEKRKVLDAAKKHFNKVLEDLLKNSTEKNLILENIIKPVLIFLQKNTELELSSHYNEILKKRAIKAIYDYEKQKILIAAKSEEYHKNFKELCMEYKNRFANSSAKHDGKEPEPEPDRQQPLSFSSESIYFDCKSDCAASINDNSKPRVHFSRISRWINNIKIFFIGIFSHKKEKDVGAEYSSSINTSKNGIESSEKPSANLQKQPTKSITFFQKRSTKKTEVRLPYNSPGKR